MENLLDKRVYSFSVKKAEDKLLIEAAKNRCETRGINFSFFLINLVREAMKNESDRRENQTDNLS